MKVAELKGLPFFYETIAKLGEHFIPMVDKVVSPITQEINVSRLQSVHFKPSDLVGPEYHVRFIDNTSPHGMHMYHLEVRLHGRLQADEMTNIAAAVLNTFASFEGGYIDLDGRTYNLGDGDDTQAVFFNNGVLSIWLRGFPIKGR